MVSNECKKWCRNAGLMTECVICLADYYDDEEGEKNKMAAYYNARYEDKENVMKDMREAASDITAELKHIKMEDLKILYDMFGISLMEYAENISNAVFAEKYDNEKTRKCAKALEKLIIDMLYLELKNDKEYKKIIKGEEFTMNRNIEILKEIDKEIEAFKYADDEISLIMDNEECDLEDLYEDNDSIITKVKMHIFKIAELLEQLTEDFRDMFDYEEFDCNSVRWCVGKVKYNDYELVNYYESFVNMTDILGFLVKEYIRLYKLLTQNSYNPNEK